MFAAAGLGEEDVEACRRRCCVSKYCASIVLHMQSPGEYGCYLNPVDDGTQKKPYYRANTLMAFVNRT